MLIEDCEFDTGDDCIAIKSGRNGDGRRVNLTSTVAGANVSLTYTGSGTRANNYDAGGSFKPGAPVAGGG